MDTRSLVIGNGYTLNVIGYTIIVTGGEKLSIASEYWNGGMME
jgi:hypothetical protein